MFCLIFDTVKAMLRRWINVRTVYRRAIEAGVSRSSAASLTAYENYMIKRMNFIAPLTKGAMAVVSSLDLVDDFLYLWLLFKFELVSTFYKCIVLVHGPMQ